MSSTADRLGSVPEETTLDSNGSVAVRLRILIVDDSEDSTEVLSIMLTHKGHDTRVANSSTAALQVAEQFTPHVAVLDIGLPEMDGYELAARLRMMPALAAIGLVAVTGHGLDSDRRRSLDAGFHQHLVKPVNLHAINDAVTSAARLPVEKG